MAEEFESIEQEFAMDNVAPQQEGAKSVSIGVVNPDAVVIQTDDGGAEVDFSDQSEEQQETGFFANLAEDLDEDILSDIASDLVNAYEDDRSSRQEWENTYTDGLDLLGIKLEERSQPFEGATGVTHPILSEAVIRFVSQSIMEIFPAGGPVRTQMYGKVNEEKTSQAKRVETYMNYVLTEEMPEYRNETEQLLFNLSLAGSAFRKVYYDPYLKRPSSVFVPADDFVVSYATTDLLNSPRHTHVMQKSDNFVRKLQLNGFYRDVELSAGSGDNDDIKTKYDELTGITEVSENDLRTILEVHTELDLEGYQEDAIEEEDTRIQLPYIVTIDKDTNTVLSIRRNYDENDPLKKPKQYFVHYKFQPGLGFYGFGLIHLIGSIAKSSTSILRQLIDAGTLANLPAGFKARGLRIKGDDSPISPGEFRDLDLPSGAIRDNIMPLPFKEPSATLAQLLGVLVDEGRRFASIADLQIGEGNQEAPVGTTLALIERSMKVMSAIHARLHASLKRELQLLASIIGSNTEQYPYDEEGEPKADFDGRVDVIPVSDPNATSFAQRIMQLQSAMQIAGSAPQLYDMRELHKRFLETAGVQEVEKVLPDKTEIPPYDPISENARMMAGGPNKVHSYQDHEAHISAHMSLLQDPSLGQNPNAKIIQQAISAHISEHMAHKYRNEAEKLMGTQLPPLDVMSGKGMPEEQEQQISNQAAQAAAQITGKAQQQAVLEQQLAAAQDPVVQQQQAELQLEQAKLQQDAQEAQLEAQTDIQKTKMRNDLEEKRLLQQKQIADDKLAVEIMKTK